MRAFRLAQRHSTALWIVAAILLTLLLRAPWLDAPLNRDEGGDALVAQAWNDDGRFAYGSVFLDRPPVLLALYRLAGDPTGIRVLGAIAAALLVVTTALIAMRVAGRRAAPYAAVIAALFASSFPLRSVLSPAELLAAVPASAAVLLLVTALDQQSRRRFGLLVGAGALAALALLVKQSFGDALAAGVIALAVAKLAGASWRETGRGFAAFLSGVALTGAALTIWALVTHTSASAIWFALFGFRIDSANALTNAPHGLQIARLETPLLASGMAIAVPIALFGISRLNARPAIRAALFAWLLAASVGILLGGSYWPHYLIALVSVTAVGVAVVLARHTRIATLGVAALAALTIAFGAPTALHDSGESFNRASVTVGDYLRAHATPGSSAYVLYTDANVLYYSGLKPAFPYNWSLMMEAVPGAVQTLRHDLASPRLRPTWVVQWQSSKAFGLDPNGVTARLVARNYRQVATVCGHKLLLARGASERPSPMAALSADACHAGAGSA